MSEQELPSRFHDTISGLTAALAFVEKEAENEKNHRTTEEKWTQRVEIEQTMNKEQRTATTRLAVAQALGAMRSKRHLCSHRCMARR